MLIVKGQYFGTITPTSDPGTMRTFYHYYIGEKAGNEVLFDGAAGDEQEALQTVAAHLNMLESQSCARAHTQRETKRGA
jgi:hypothetical protein